MRWIRIGVVAVFALAAIASALAGSLAGRGEDAEASASPSASPDLSATAEIRRSFMDQGQVAIAVTNHGDAPVHAIGVELVSESFAPLGVQEIDATVPPSDHARDLLTDYGEARCPDGVASTAAPSSVVLSVETEDGAAHEVVLELSYPNGTLDQLLREACAAQAIAASTAIELGALTERPDRTLEGGLTLRPLAGAALGVTNVRGSVLFDLTAESLADGPDAAAAGEDLVVALHFDASRCGGHAVGDAKQPFGFTMWVAIDGGEPIATAIEVPDAQRDALWAMLDVRCGRPD